MKWWKQTLERSLIVVLPLLFVTFLVAGGKTSADILKSPDYQLQPTVGNSFGGSIGSTSYKLTDSGGEPVIGDGSGGSYKLSAGYVAELPHSINLYVEPSGLVGYWPMNEGAGPTIHDASANSNDGTASGSPTWVQGKIGDSLSFNGTNQYVNLPSSTSLDAGLGSATWSAWFKTTSSAAEFIYRKSGSCNQNGIILDVNGGKVNAYISYYSSGTGCSGGYVTVSALSGTGYNDGSWHQAVAVLNRSNNTLALYVDGEAANSVAADSIAGINLTSGNAGVIGSSYTGSANQFSGSIDDVKIYNRALTADEVEANYEANSNSFDSGLVIPALQAGVSQTVNADVIVSADAPYSLLTRETGLLTDESDSSVTIPSIGATIASPAAWQEGVTKGFGFTVLSGPSGVDGKWAGGANFAAIPSAATSFYNRTGFSGGVKDVIKLQYRLDVSGSQPSGRYKNNVVYTATMTP